MPMDFAQNVLSNIIAGLVVVALVGAAGFLTFGRLRQNWHVFRYARRMKKGGITNFFCTRHEFSTLRLGSTLSEYLSLTRKELIYVGFYLSGGTDRARVDDALTGLLQKGCRVELVFLDPDIEDNVLQCIERFLAIATGTLRTTLQHALTHFQNFAVALSEQDRARFFVRVHRTILASSAFLIDYDEADGRVLVDTKIHGAGRDFSYAIEFARSAPGPSLATEYAKSFKRLAVGSTLVTLP